MSAVGYVVVVCITVFVTVIVEVVTWDSFPITRPERRRIICCDSWSRLCYKMVLLSNKYLTYWLKYLLYGIRVQFSQKKSCRTVYVCVRGV